MSEAATKPTSAPRSGSTQETRSPAAPNPEPELSRAPTGAEIPNKLCPECGRGMWAARLPEVGVLWSCPACCLSLDEGGGRYEWREPPRLERAAAEAKENKYRSNEPCPRCRQGLWIVDVPNYGSRKQCEDCRITIMFGSGILEWSNR